MPALDGSKECASQIDAVRARHMESDSNELLMLPGALKTDGLKDCSRFISP